MATITTTNGTVYLLSEDRTTAYPDRGPQKARTPSCWSGGGTYNESDWGEDTARACGVLVDATIPRDDYRVRGAGPEWREVYESLRSMLAATNHG